MAHQNLTNKERIAQLEVRVKDGMRASKAESQEIKQDVKNVEGGVQDLLVTMVSIETTLNAHVEDSRNGKASKKVQLGLVSGGFITLGSAVGAFAKEMGLF